ncbi:MAG: DUF1801 domain-containing protein [Anaerolineaceae bacterium]|jgi:uncharacterized protein YdhG (YjbR/CyaY superfamily)|nr:DUF1801 domain-containing protein [Anaerolineaceae bacterium]
MMENEIDAYLKTLPKDHRVLLEKVREIALGVEPDLEQTISYGIPTLKKNGKNVLHFAAQKAHLGLYPGSDAIAHFEDRLKDYETSKGTIKVPYVQPLDFKLIEDLVLYNLERVAKK